jgi:hypothetical protein
LNSIDGKNAKSVSEIFRGNSSVHDLMENLDRRKLSIILDLASPIKYCFDTAMVYHPS